MTMFSTPRFSDWRIAGSAGGTVSLETPVVNVSVGNSYLCLPLENTRTGERIELHMTGGTVGVGVGQSVFGPVAVDFSAPNFPSNGIGKIVAGFRAPDQITRESFTGNIVKAGSVGAQAGPGASLVGLLFYSPQRDLLSIVADAFAAGLTSVIPTTLDDRIVDMAQAQCGGLFWGAGLGSSASAGANGFLYVVSTVT